MPQKPPSPKKAAKRQFTIDPESFTTKMQKIKFTMGGKRTLDSVGDYEENISQDAARSSSRDSCTKPTMSEAPAKAAAVAMVTPV